MSVYILGIKINVTEKEKAHKILSDTLQFGGQKVMFTPNPQMINEARQNIALREIINSADISICDGTGVYVAAKIQGTPIKERITGIDTAEYLLELSAKKGYRVFLLGGEPCIADIAAKKLCDRYKGLNVCGAHHGYFNKDGKENRFVIEKIKKSKPDILFVCMGTPMQERWIYNNKEELKEVKLLAGLGGSIDVWSGKYKRAPRFVRTLCLEWLWRCLQDVSKAGRISGVFDFLAAVICEKAKARIDDAKNRVRNIKKQ